MLPSTRRFQDRLSPQLIFAFLLLAAAAFYARSWNSYFVCDDYEFLGRINLHNAVRYFGQSWAYGNEYRPLLPYSYALDAVFSGNSPVGYHITNTILHVLSAWLLVMIAIEFEISKWASLLLGFLFLLNPVAHEALLWISGRPVLLSTSLQLLSIWCLVAPKKWIIPWRVTASVACFVLALLTYEGAIALPFVLLALFVTSAIMRQKCTWGDLTPFFVILAVYLSFWFWIFNFHLVRQRQDSLIDGVRGVALAILHSWHGAYRPIVGLVYLIALVWFLRNRASRKTALGLFAIFFAAYLPFFMSKGFAPRFAYFPSAALCLLLAYVVIDLFETNKKLGVAALFSLLLFYGLGMQSLISQWRDAGEIARNISQGIVRSEPTMPAHATIAISGAPLMYKHAYVYMTGLQRAVTRLYDEPITVIQHSDPICSIAADRHFRYADGRVGEAQCDSH